LTETANTDSKMKIIQRKDKKLVLSFLNIKIVLMTADLLRKTKNNNWK